MNIPSNTPPAPNYGSSGGGTNSMALISLISAGVTWILGWLGGCGLSALLGPFALGCSGIGLISTVVGIITGHMGMGQTGAGSSESGSRWMAITGLILNYLSVLLMVLGLCFVLLVFGGALAFLGLNAEEFQQMLTPMP